MIELPAGSLPPLSTSVDLTQAEFNMMEADMVPGDFWIVPMGIEGYERFLSADCAGGASAVFGERAPSVYQRISDVAAEQGISLEQGYAVWVVGGDTVTASGDGNPVFANMGAATAFAEKHSKKVRVFVTGPVKKQCIEITNRRP